MSREYQYHYELDTHNSCNNVAPTHNDGLMSYFIVLNWCGFLGQKAEGDVDVYILSAGLHVQAIILFAFSTPLGCEP